MVGFPGLDGMQTTVVVGAPASAPVCAGCGQELPSARLLLDVTLPIRTVSEANQRAPWAVTKRKAEQRKAVGTRLRAWQASGMGGAPLSLEVPVDVQLTRIAPCRLDSDNLGSAFKAVRDEIAKWLGVDDKKEDLVRWLPPAQCKGKPREYGVRIEIRERVAR